MLPDERKKIEEAKEYLSCLKLRTDISLGEDGYKQIETALSYLTSLLEGKYVRVDISDLLPIRQKRVFGRPNEGDTETFEEKKSWNHGYQEANADYLPIFAKLKSELEEATKKGEDLCEKYGLLLIDLAELRKKVEELPSEEEIKRIVEREGWSLRAQWMPECNDDKGDFHADCPVYQWNEDEKLAIEKLTIAIATRLNPEQKGEGR